MYVGAFQDLANKQYKYDNRWNQGNAKSSELTQLMHLAKNLLCEIETAINDSTTLTMPNVYTRQQMEHKLHVRSDYRDRSMHDEVDDLGNKFAKVRFHEYLRSLDRIMKLPRKKRSRRLCKNRKYKGRSPCNKRDVDCKGTNCTLIDPPMETPNRHSQHRLHHRLRTGHGGHKEVGDGAGVRVNQIVDENPTRSQRPHWRHRQNRHRNQLNNQIVDGTAANGLSAPMRRNRRRKLLRAIDVSSTTTTPTLSPFSAQ